MEITLKKGGRIKGILSEYCNEGENGAGKGIRITTSRMVKPEGAKKKTEQQTTVFYPLEEVRECKPVIKFR